MTKNLRVVCRRRFRASVEAVFAAFTEAELLTRWFSPSEDIRTEIAELDLQEGGAYRFGFHFADGTVRWVAGRFQEILPPRRLVYSWTWEAPDPHAGIETLVTVQLVEREGGTEVVVEHERFPDDETRERHDAGWGTTLDRLETLLRRLEEP